MKIPPFKLLLFNAVKTVLCCHLVSVMGYTSKITMYLLRVFWSFLFRVEGKPWSEAYFTFNTAVFPYTTENIHFLSLWCLYNEGKLSDILITFS